MSEKTNLIQSDIGILIWDLILQHEMKYQLFRVAPHVITPQSVSETVDSGEDDSASASQKLI